MRYMIEKTANRRFIAPYIVIPLIIAMFSCVGYILYRDTPLFYTLKVCNSDTCKTYICPNIRVKGNEITIYQNRTNHKVKQIFVISKDDNAIVTPTYR